MDITLGRTSDEQAIKDLQSIMGRTAPVAPAAPSSTFNEMSKAFKQGLYGVAPKMAGEAIKAFSPVGSRPYQLGENLAEAGGLIAQLPELQRENYDGRGEIAKIAIAGAGGVGQMAPIIAASAIPGVGPVLGGVGAAALYGGSTYQDTKERMLKQDGLDDAFAAANPNDPRVIAANRSAIATGAVQGLGEGLMDYTGAKFMHGAALPILGKIGLAPTAEGVLQAAAAPGKAMAKQFAKGMAIRTPLEGVTEVIQDEGQAAIERAYGLKDAPKLGEQAVESARGGVGTALLMAPLGIPGHYVQAKQLGKVTEALSDPTVDPLARQEAALQVAKNIHAASPESAQNFLSHAYDAIGDESLTGSAPYALDLNNPALLQPASAPAAALPAAPVDTAPAQPAVETVGDQLGAVNGPLSAALATVADMPAVHAGMYSGQMPVAPDEQPSMQLGAVPDAGPNVSAMLDSIPNGGVTNDVSGVRQEAGNPQEVPSVWSEDVVARAATVAPYTEKQADAVRQYQFIEEANRLSLAADASGNEGDHLSAATAYKKALDEIPQENTEYESRAKYVSDQIQYHEKRAGRIVTVSAKESANDQIQEVQGRRQKEVATGALPQASTVERQALIDGIKSGNIKMSDLTKTRDGKLTAWEHEGKTHAYTEGPVSQSTLLATLEGNAAPAAKKPAPTPQPNFLKLQAQAKRHGQAISKKQADGSYRLGEQSFPTLADIQQHLDTLPEPAAKLAPRRATGRNMLEDIKKAGGIKLASIINGLDVNEVRGAKGKGNRYLKVTGKADSAMGLDQMAQAMLDAGYPVPTDLNGRADTDGFAQMLKDAVNGSLPLHPSDEESTIDKAAAEYETKMLENLTEEQVDEYRDIELTTDAAVAHDEIVDEMVSEIDDSDLTGNEAYDFFAALALESNNEKALERESKPEVAEVPAGDQDQDSQEGSGDTGRPAETPGNAEVPAQSVASPNTIFTKDAYEAARLRMRERLITLHAGIDPQLFADGMAIAGYHIESGVRKFADFVKVMTDDFGDAIRPYLKSFYEGARRYPGMTEVARDMDSTDAVEAFDTAAPTEAIAPPAAAAPVETAPPLAEKVSTSGEMQNKLFATPPTFGKKAQAGGRAVSTGDLLDNFTKDPQQDLFSSARTEPPVAAVAPVDTLLPIGELPDTLLVEHKVFDENGAPHRAQIPAKEALADINNDIDEARELLACVKG